MRRRVLKLEESQPIGSVSVKLRLFVGLIQCINTTRWIRLKSSRRFGFCSPRSFRKWTYRIWSKSTGIIGFGVCRMNWRISIIHNTSSWSITSFKFEYITMSLVWHSIFRWRFRRRGMRFQICRYDQSASHDSFFNETVFTRSYIPTDDVCTTALAYLCWGLRKVWI